MEYKYIADMGSIKIKFEGGAAFFNNDFGDGEFKVHVYNNLRPVPKDADFKGHFTVFTEAYLMKYDYSNKEHTHAFNKGRWFVYLDKDGVTFYIIKEDNNIEC